MIERHSNQQQQIVHQDQQIEYLLQELSLKDSIIKTQNNLISVSNLDIEQISYPKSNLTNYNDYELIQQESKSLIELISKQESSNKVQSQIQQNSSSSDYLVLPNLIKQKPRINSLLIGGGVVGKNRRSQSESEPYISQQPLRLSYSYAVQKMQPIQSKKKLKNPLSQLMSKDIEVKKKQRVNSKFQKIMSKISVDTTLPTEANDVTKSTQHQNSSSLSNSNNTHNNNANNSNSNKGKNDIDYLLKYSEIIFQPSTGKQNLLSPKIYDGNGSSRSHSLQKQKVGQSQKLLQNVLQSSRVRNQNALNSKNKYKQPYLSKLLVDYSNYMYSDLGALSNQDIVLNKSNSRLKQFNQNESIDEINQPHYRIQTEMPTRNQSHHVLDDISYNQQMEFNNLFNNNRVTSSAKRKIILSQKRKSAFLQNSFQQN